LGGGEGSSKRGEGETQRKRPDKVEKKSSSGSEGTASRDDEPGRLLSGGAN